MDRYIEMGFSENDASLALDRFGDDLHAGCHWLMTRESMGSVPKRLRTSNDNRTYLGSNLMLNGTRYVVDEYDKKHALILIREINGITSRWEHISDGRMDWQSVQHQTDRFVVPTYAWKRKVGTLYFPTTFFSVEACRSGLTKENALEKFCVYNCPHNVSPLWSLRRSVVALVKECFHEPSGKCPRSWYAEDVHEYHIELMSYFYAMCDFYNVSREDFDNLLIQNSMQKICQVFPSDIRSNLMDKLQRWKSPCKYLKKDHHEWRKNCLPLVLFECECIENSVVHFSVYFHDMTFVRPNGYEFGMHNHLQRLFCHLWPNSMLSHAPSNITHASIDSEFLSTILRDSHKKHLTNASPEHFETELMPYQKKCLSWLLKREQIYSTSNWGWSQHRLMDGFAFHTSVFGHLSLSTPNNKIRGGLLAQDVGMGKTIEMLALIATNKAPGPTLVIMPTTMLGPWQNECEKHVPSLSVVKFHGSRRTKDMNVLRRADIVLTTYRVVVNETSQHVPSIASVKWGRIILDESHEMKSIFLSTTKSICRLYAPYKWCVSATPFQNTRSMIALLAFLGVCPFDESIKQGQYSAACNLIRNQTITTKSMLYSCLKNFTFWQKKSHVSLNLPEVIETSVGCTSKFKDIYKHLHEVVTARIALDKTQPNINGRTRILHYTRWLRQACIHPQLNKMCNYGIPCDDAPVQSKIKEIDSFLETLGHDSYDESLRNIIDSWRNGQEKCSICMDAMDRPTLTPCHHMFCFECINSAYHHDHLRKCPLCRVPAGTAPLEELKLAEEFDPEAIVEDDNCYISDVDGKLRKIPRDIRNQIIASKSKSCKKFEYLLGMLERSDEKIILFTQFHGAMKLFIETLKSKNIQYASIEGSMTPNQRTKQIEKFQNDSNTKIFVMTTKTASVGITLTAGSQIVFLEPCLDKSTKKQAIGRAWRIGQTKQVHVTTLYTEGTIDDPNCRQLTI